MQFISWLTGKTSDAGNANTATTTKLRELSSDYFDMSTFYYDSTTNFVWELDNSMVARGLYKPNLQVYQHICELNKIKGNYWEQPATRSSR